MNKTEGILPVVGYEGLYFATNTGRVFRNARIGSRGKFYPPKELTPSPDKSGYIRMSLLKNGVRSYIYAHRIIALTFLGPPPTPEHIVNHLDTNKTNNKVSNLEWATLLENWDHAFKAGCFANNKGVGIKSAKLDDETVACIRAEAAAGATNVSLAKKYNVSTTAIGCVVRRIYWKHVA